MASYIVDGNALTNIADAIREKGGTTSSLIFPQGFIDAINAIDGGGSILKKITISTATTTGADTYDAIQAQLESSEVNWIAFVNDDNYITGEGDKCVAVVGSYSTNQRALYRNDASYNYMRKMDYSASTMKVPANTEFNVFVFPAQPDIT